MKQEIVKYNGLTANEIGLVARLEYEGKDVYTRSDIISFCDDKSNGVYLIRRLLIKKRLRPIVKNVYLFIPMKAPGGKWAGNEYVIAKALARGAKYYIGYSSVFNSYGFTDQVAQMIHVVNEKYSLMKNVGGIRYKLIKALPDRMYGLESRRINKEDIIFASKERSLIDAFEFYDVKKAYSILSGQISKINMAVFINYLAQYSVQKIRRRVGYFLERLGVNKKLLNNIYIGEKGYSLLYDTGPNRGKIDNSWRLIING